MSKIFKYCFSLYLLLFALQLQARDADTVKAARSVSAGIELTGPVLYSLDKSSYNFEGYLSYRLNNKYYLVCEPGLARFYHEQYNYEYQSHGWFLRLGTDIGMLQPVAAKINHFAGIGLRYGFSLFEHETPVIGTDNFWGSTTSSVPLNSVHAHFLELQGSIKTEITRNLLIGWSVKLRTLIYSSGKKEKQAVYIPGMGRTDNAFVPAISYYIIYRIPLGKASGE
ncbi:MAG: hypothetical protein KFF49_10955 [Bacteroidales bacterium]|nr:hypothetical protein [Bacteroidales bacterium]